MTKSGGRIFVFIVLSFVLAGCSFQRKLFYRPDELKQEIERLFPDDKHKQVVVPFDVPPEAIKRAKQLLSLHMSTSKKAQVLRNAMFDPKEFGLVYVEDTTRTARETLMKKKGNCFSLASVYIGLARKVGLKAYYLDISGWHEEVRHEEDVIVRRGHLTAVIETETGRSALDFGLRLGPFRLHRIMDDKEATAHFYNNRGYELIHQATKENKQVDWIAAADNFRLATLVKPDFVRAWNNLGVAFARMGNIREASVCYQQAIQLNSDFISPYTNLGILHLNNQQPQLAVDAFRLAAKLDYENARLHYHLGLAWYRNGKIEQAISALEKSLALDPDYKKSRRLLTDIISP
jgi:tetratricopeptide (TPR) repeat protein